MARKTPSSKNVDKVRAEYAGLYNFKKIGGYVSGPLVFALLLMLPAPEGMTQEGWRVAAVLGLMMVWWLSEAIPLAATALLPVVLFPLLGILDIGPTASAYGSPVVFLFMGGFILAIGMERWNLHIRIALTIVKLVGTNANTIVAGFMLATAFLSMWISNTATVVMMLPIAVSVITLLLEKQRGKPGAENFAISMMLGLAYAASIGGVGTLIGTPPNAVLVGYVEEAYGIQISFARWMALGAPVAFVMLIICWLMLVKWLYPSGLGRISGSASLINEELDKLGPMSRGEKTVLVVFCVTAAMWIFRGTFNTMFPGLGLTDTGIAIAAAVSLFLIPVNMQKYEFVLNWKEAEKLPWGILILFGGGLALASAVKDSGLAEWVGGEISAMGHASLLMLIFIIVVVVKILTEFMSNVATITTFLPIIAALASAFGYDPLLLMVPATMAVSFAFMTPVATPPNAIVFGSGHLTIPQMARAGFWLNLVTILIVPFVGYYLVERILLSQ